MNVKRSRGRGRSGVSEITGSLMMIALTLIAGAAVFGWAIGQAGVSEGALGQNAASQANHYHESFVIVGVQFSGCQNSGSQRWCNQVSVAVYNNGEVGLTVQSVELSNVGSTSASGYSVPTLTLPLGLTTASTGAYSCSNSGADPCVYTCGTTTGPATGQTFSETLLPPPGSGSSDEPITADSSPPTVFTITLPASCTTTTEGILDGALYSVQLVGLYGNSVTVEVTANG